MITFHPIQTTDDPLWPLMKEIYLQSFPPEEQRPMPLLEPLLGTEPQFHPTALLNGSHCVGLLHYWIFSQFYYIEHFALSPAERSKGYGAQALHLLLQQTTSPLVLEVEPPTDELTCRRVNFYQRCGFTLLPNAYFQPPYCPEQMGLPLRIMVTGKANSICFEEIQNTLYSRIYGIR